MKALKTRQEYELMKDKMSKDIDDFLLKFNEFITSTSPSYWRTTGSLYTDIKNFKDKLKEFEPFTAKNLENDWFFDQVATEEEKKLKKSQDKYNL